jgi:hypothetical protein
MAFITLTGGSATFAVFLVVVLVALVLSTYTRRGSAINQRPYGNVHGDAPGAFAASDLAHDRDAARRLTRGTRA